MWSALATIVVFHVGLIVIVIGGVLFFGLLFPWGWLVLVFLYVLIVDGDPKKKEKLNNWLKNLLDKIS